MKGHRQILVPKNVYQDLVAVQERLKREQSQKVPLWKCAEHLAVEKQRWTDSQWLSFKKNRKGNLFDMFSILFIAAAGLIFIVIFILFINGLNSAIQGDAQMNGAPKQFMNNIQSQNAWVLDFIFTMLLISLPLVSSILAYFNNIPPFLFWASIGLLLLIVVLANIVGDAYANITSVGSVQVITSSIPMTHWIMSHFVIYAMLSSIMIMFGVFVKGRSGGYGP